MQRMAARKMPWHRPCSCGGQETAMPTMKRYTNTTFTHRPDHDGGRHKTARGAGEPVLCAGCGAIYARKRWTHSNAAKVRAAARAGHPIAIRICPGCRRRNANVPHGFVHVDGEFVAPHRDDILRLMQIGRAHV